MVKALRTIREILVDKITYPFRREVFAIKQFTAVWGLGNELYGDDQVGIRVCQNLAKMDQERRFDVCLCYTVPGNYVARLRKNTPSMLIIVDASDMDITPGEFRRFSLDEIADVSFTNHDMPIDLMLEPYRKITTVIGIQPQRVELGSPMTSLMVKTASVVAEIILAEKTFEIPKL